MAIMAYNFSQAEQTAHTLHGSIKFCGFTVFQGDINALETALTQQNIDLSRQYFVVLHDKLLDLLAQQDEIMRYLGDR